jgi:hypothetical protein
MPKTLTNRPACGQGAPKTKFILGKPIDQFRTRRINHLWPGRSEVSGQPRVQWVYGNVLRGLEAFMRWVVVRAVRFMTPLWQILTLKRIPGTWTGLFAFNSRIVG